MELFLRKLLRSKVHVKEKIGGMATPLWDRYELYGLAWRTGLETISFTLMRHGGEGKQMKIFAIGLQAPIGVIVKERLLKGPLPDRQHHTRMI